MLRCRQRPALPSHGAGAHRADLQGRAAAAAALAQDVAAATGVILDPVYSGKSLHCMIKDMQERPEAWRGRRVLFWHTGGLLGLYDKAAQLQPLVEAQGKVSRLQL
jgi:hypothetical protein